MGVVDSTTFGAQVHIGNQWMWDQGFFIDVRWIGYSRIFTETTLITASGNVSDQALEEAKEEFVNSELELFSGANFLLISMSVAF